MVKRKSQSEIPPQCMPEGEKIFCAYCFVVHSVDVSFFHLNFWSVTVAIESENSPKLTASIVKSHLVPFPCILREELTISSLLYMAWQLKVKKVKSNCYQIFGISR